MVVSFLGINNDVMSLFVLAHGGAMGRFYWFLSD